MKAMYFVKSKYWSHIYDETLVFKLRCAVKCELYNVFQRPSTKKECKLLSNNFIIIW